MVSNLKRYKKLIETLKKSLEKSNSINNGVLSIPIIVTTKQEYCNFQFSMFYNFKISNSLRAVELDKDKIIIGLDLNKLPSLSMTTPQNSFMWSDEEIREHIFHDKIYWGSSTEELYKSITPYSTAEITNNHSLLDSTDLFEKVKESLKEILSGDVFELKLGDDEFPKLEDRKILPIIIIDLGNTSVKYYDSEYIMSYRRRQRTTTIDSALSGNYNPKRMRVPKKLVRISCNSSDRYVKTVRLYV